MHTIRSTHAYLFSVLRDFGLPSSWTEPYHIMNTIINHETAIMGHILSKKVSCIYVRGNIETMRGTTNIYLNIVSLFRLNNVWIYITDERCAENLQNHRVLARPFRFLIDSISIFMCNSKQDDLNSMMNPVWWHFFGFRPYINVHINLSG